MARLVRLRTVPTAPISSRSIEKSTKSWSLLTRNRPPPPLACSIVALPSMDDTCLGGQGAQSHRDLFAVCQTAEQRQLRRFNLPQMLSDHCSRQHRRAAHAKRTTPHMRARENHRLGDSMQNMQRNHSPRHTPRPTLCGLFRIPEAGVIPLPSWPHAHLRLRRCVLLLLVA